MSTHADPPHILIIGAGITGLVLAQALRSHGVRFTIYERDPDISYRGRGWGLTIHWALDTLLSLLPQDVINRLPETYVDPVAVAAGEKGTFPFFDLRNGERRWQLTSPNRIRVGRERLRRLLMEGIDVKVSDFCFVLYPRLSALRNLSTPVVSPSFSRLELTNAFKKWSHTLTSITHPTPQTVNAHFSNTTSPSVSVSAIGSLLIGADGSHSAVRSHLLPSSISTNTRLPIRFLGISAPFPSALALSVQALDSFFFQGGDPLTDLFLYFSFFSTPKADERELGEGQWEGQICISYPYRAGFWGKKQPMEVPGSDAERVALMKDFAEGWKEPFRGLVMSLGEDTAVKELVVEDYLPEHGIGKEGDGKVALVGDAGHAMTICELTSLNRIRHAAFDRLGRQSNRGDPYQVLSEMSRDYLSLSWKLLLTHSPLRSRRSGQPRYRGRVGPSFPHPAFTRKVFSFHDNERRDISLRRSDDSAYTSCGAGESTSGHGCA